MRVKTGFVRRQKHKKILRQAKGFWMSRHKLYKKAREAVLHAGAYAYHGRKRRKRDFRRLWTIRINAALREKGRTYSRFIQALKEQKIELDRKILADLAVHHPLVFNQISDAAFKPQKPGAGAH